MFVEINNSFEEKVPSDFIKETALRVLKNIKTEGLIGDDLPINLSLAVVDKSTIREHNLKYRQKDEPTDVLSFCYENSEEEGIVGEIILCREIIADYAKVDGIDELEGFKKNITHGILHILGYEHGDEMFNLQDRI